MIYLLGNITFWNNNINRNVAIDIISVNANLYYIFLMPGLAELVLPVLIDNNSTTLSPIALKDRVTNFF